MIVNSIKNEFCSNKLGIDFSKASMPTVTVFSPSELLNINSKHEFKCLVYHNEVSVQLTNAFSTSNVFRFLDTINGLTPFCFFVTIMQRRSKTKYIYSGTDISNAMVVDYVSNLLDNLKNANNFKTLTVTITFYFDINFSGSLPNCHDVHYVVVDKRSQFEFLNLQSTLLSDLGLIYSIPGVLKTPAVFDCVDSEIVPSQLFLKKVKNFTTKKLI